MAADIIPTENEKYAKVFSGLIDSSNNVINNTNPSPVKRIYGDEIFIRSSNGEWLNDD